MIDNGKQTLHYKSSVQINIYNLTRMKKYYYLLLAILVMSFVSCSSEDAKIKKALKESVSESLKSEYKYNSHLLLETILKSNLTDSIAALNFDIEVVRDIMRLDSLRLENIQDNMAECRRQRANTLYFLRSTYDSLIEDYEEMEEEIVEKLEEKNREILEKEAKVAFWSQSMYEADSPIVFYKVKHAYKMRGMHKDTVVILNSKYEIVK